MTKTIQLDKNIDREELDKELANLDRQKKPIDLKKYSGKIKFSVEGSKYRQQVRDEWR